MCGSPGKLFKAIVEGAELNVCQECSRFGKVVGVVEQRQLNYAKAIPKEAEELIDILVEGYQEKIRKQRELLGLNQKDFAKMLNEKESLIQKIESGHFEPSIGLAKKIQGFLKIRLVEDYKEEAKKPAKTRTDTFTIGDFIKIKEK